MKQLKSILAFIMTFVLCLPGLCGNDNPGKYRRIH